MIFRRRLHDVLEELAREGVLTVEALTRAKSAADQQSDGLPWFVRVLIGGGAWVAAILTMIFIGMTGLLDNKSLAVFVGLAMLGGATALRRVAPGDFPAQLALSLGLAGQVLAIWGVYEQGRSASTALAFAVVLELGVIAVYPDKVQRFLSAGAAAGALVLFAHEAKLGADLAVAVVALLAGAAWHFEPRLVRDARFAPMQRPVGYGLVVALLGTLLFGVIEVHDTFRIGPAAALGVGVALVVLVVAVLQEQKLPLSAGASPAVLSATVLLAGASYEAPGVVAALYVMVLACHRRDVLLLGLATVFLVTFGVHFYYHLAVSLLDKAGTLVGSGAVLLGIFALLRRRAPAPAPQGAPS